VADSELIERIGDRLLIRNRRRIADVEPCGNRLVTNFFRILFFCLTCRGLPTILIMLWLFCTRIGFLRLPKVGNRWFRQGMFRKSGFAS
jgi:hypothetical protein